MFTNLPDELQKEIVTYLDTPSLRFFAMTSQRSLSNALSLLVSRQQKLLRPPIVSLMASGWLTCCYTSKAVYVCGDNSYGQLGLDHTNDCTSLTLIAKRPPGTVQQIVASACHVLILTDRGLYSYGYPGFSQLELSHNDGTTFAPIAKLPPGRIQQMAAGYNHTLALTDQGLYVCGRNSFGQLGLGNRNDRAVFTPVMQPLLRIMIQQVTAGAYHTLVLTNQGLYVCGSNRSGQLGLGHTDDSSTLTLVTELPSGTILQIAAGYNHTLVLTDQGLFACGANGYGQLGLGHTNDCATFTPLVKLPPGKIRQVVAGAYHTLVLTDQGLFACGDNGYGQLGLDNMDNCTILTSVETLPPESIQQVVAGAHHTLVLTNQGLYACGSNRAGQLGLGHTNDCTILTSLEDLFPELRQLQVLYSRLGRLITLSESKRRSSRCSEHLNQNYDPQYFPKNSP